MLSKHSQAIQDLLLKKGFDIKVIEIPESTRTANDAAKALSCQVGQIVKSLIFQTRETHRPILVLASGINRVNEKTLSHIVGEAITKADADFTKEVTGFVIGGIPPIGHKEVIETYIDQDLLKYDVLWAAAGSPFAVFKLDSCDIEALTNGKLISVQ